MKKYLIGICYHEPEDWNLFQNGIDDYESSTAVFINAESEMEAITWGENIAQKLFELTNPNETNK